ncbi:hypothetical protein [Archangium violaceum]|uniref:Uncharacterized protein n=1 Tax=Archangium violaceum Cb vi76 TaxID=1406225 RepID=A0A084SKM0_9BACT|nr:hypothetical protein [Archangium violaceum]KFA89005.1 hypothetical protein Q664_37725 [Archangium violaceum Cb vi76]
MELRKPLFIAALVLFGLCVLVEVGASILLPRPVASRADIEANLRSEGAQDDVSVDEVLDMQRRNEPTPGMGIPYLALVDGLVLLTLGLMGASLLVPERVHGQVQGVVSLVGALVALIAGITMLVGAIGLLLLMVSLFTAVPFGTIAYLAIWGFFNRGGASATLGLLMSFKVAALICLALAHPRFLQNKGLVLLVLTSLLAGALVSLLHGWVPLVLVSITDAIGAIIVALLGLVWAVVLFIGALVSILRVLKLKRTAL